MDNKYYLPREIDAVLQKCYQGDLISSANLRLLLHKHVPKDVIINKTGDRQDSPKTTWLRNIASRYKARKELVEAARHRWQGYIDTLQANFVSMTIDWRMIVGLGGNSVFETDMTLHPLYGLPIIPGSALKGLTRAWAKTEKNEKTQVPGPEGKPVLLVERIFGNEREGETQHAGSVIFFDAILMNENFRLALDIMNPHYPRYYQEGKPPSNDQDPVPIPFLTVMSATFLFAIAPRNPLNSEHRADARIALQWLQEALIEYGIGSKTSSGYGYMRAKLLYKRPEKLPEFQVGQSVTGMLLGMKNREDLQIRFPAFATHLLKHPDFSTNEVVIALIDKEKVATRWQTGTSYTCSFLYEYEQIRDNCTVLVCQPVAASPNSPGRRAG